MAVIIEPIAPGASYEDVKERLVTLVEGWLGDGSASGVNTPFIWGDMRQMLNVILTYLGQEDIGPNEGGASARQKINFIVSSDSDARYAITLNGRPVTLNDLTITITKAAA